ncbi:RagB/SusD family nutrient uptake outer membrane protein [Sphingobacterium paucimobilis]|uniref:Glycan metabolism protein RagB n=1 Tax=Sphingobacterium paucimobilis HER1398 TaxID=1346330 RepID=U2IYR4_9SPHI|nr:RagB/SusD family nutrient uptake outer membrane protein [Sphingobacterium paucimobilis]ERJ57854.1 hypothetical protein M472_03650 [Sphingobacterium paucimobilis HER1398]ERJ60305.1 hypothetical protein M472_16220 [Sphingobacterium paucimobilis HER1398]
MRKIVYYLIGLAAISSFSACDKILDKQPKDFYPSVTDYYDTEEHLEGSIRGVYNTLKASMLYGGQMHYMLGFEADEGYYSRDGVAIGPHANNFTSGHSSVYNFWKELYTGIGRANIFLANVDHNKEIEQAFRDKLRGEALFLRAYYYFMLVKTYGGVPLSLEPIKDVEDIDKPRATAKEVYEQIIRDMTEAEGLVDGIQKIGHGGRVSKSAVRGILARVCLHMAGYPVRDLTKYAEAKAWALKVMNDPEFRHELNPDFKQIFINYAQDIYDPKESIWEVEFMGNGSDAYSETGQVGYMSGPISTSDVIGQCFGGVRVTSKLYDLYTTQSIRGSQSSSTGDLRRDWTIASFTYDGSKHDFSTSYSTSFTAVYRNYRHVGKFRREYETLLPKHRTRTPQNFPLLRYADVLLMYAEADYETVYQGNELSNGVPSAEAVDAIRKVRLRSYNVGGIRNFGINNPGSGYTTPPKIAMPAGTGSGAVITARIHTTGVNKGQLAGFDLGRDPVTGFKMGKGYTADNSGNMLVITPRQGSARANARFYAASDVELQASELDDFRKTIQDERMRELAFETIRKWDLTRWGIFEFEMRQVKNFLNTSGMTDRYFYSYFANARDKHKLWPIPARELNLNNELVQNPGW